MFFYDSKNFCKILLHFLRFKKKLKTNIFVKSWVKAFSEYVFMYKIHFFNFARTKKNGQRVSYTCTSNMSDVAPRGKILLSHIWTAWHAMWYTFIGFEMFSMFRFLVLSRFRHKSCSRPFSLSHVSIHTQYLCLTSLQVLLSLLRFLFSSGVQLRTFFEIFSSVILWTWTCPCHTNCLLSYQQLCHISLLLLILFFRLCPYTALFSCRSPLLYRTSYSFCISFGEPYFWWARCSYALTVVHML